MSETLNPPSDMRRLLDHVEKTFSAEEQEELLAFASHIEARRTGFYDMTEEEEAAVLEGLAQADRGEFVSEETRAAALKRYGL